MMMLSRISFVCAVLVAIALGWVYTAILFEPPPIAGWLAMAGLAWLAIAAWAAQVAHARPSPGATSDEITPAAGVDPEQPSFPSAHAAVAGAAATVLAYLIPDAAACRFERSRGRLHFHHVKRLDFGHARGEPGTEIHRRS